MVEFERSITAAEVRSYHLNLTSDSGKRFGELFPEHRTKFVVIDGKGRATAAQEHNDNQFWGMLKNWFIDNDVQPGDRVSIKFDPDERRDGQNVVRLILEAASALRPKVQEEEAVLKYAILAHASLVLKYFRLRLEPVSEEQLQQDDVAF